MEKEKNEEWLNRKDGVEEVEEAGLVNKHIFWRSAGGNALEGPAIWEGQISVRVVDVTEVLLSLTG